MKRKQFSAKIQKVQEKGGWTYITTPFNSAKFFGQKGYIKVTGSVDGHNIGYRSLMAMGDGTHMLPLNAEIRKAIDKDVGDTVDVILNLAE